MTAPFTVSAQPDITENAELDAQLAKGGRGDGAWFRVTGKRAHGLVKAQVRLGSQQVWSGSDDDPQIIEVHVSLFNSPEPLTINGVELDGYLSVRINGWNPPSINGGYLTRKPYGAEVTDAGRAVAWDVAKQVAGLYGTPENVHAARIRDAESTAARAADKLAEAAAELGAADAALSAARAAKVAPIRVMRSKA